MTRFIVLISVFLFCCSTADKDKERLNQAVTKVLVMDVSAQEIYGLNQNLLQKNDSVTIELLLLFTEMDDTLQLIRDELITVAGGYTELGQYINLPAYRYVDDYFYGETTFRNNGHKYFFQSIDTFNERLKEIYPGSTFKQRIDKKFQILTDHYGLESKELIFKGMTLNEVVELIESFRKVIALEQTDCLIKRNN